MESAFQLAYIAAAVLFIVGLKMLGRAETARRGNAVSAVGMLVAVVATLLQSGIDYALVAAGLVVGGGIGAVWARRVKMTQMPETVAIFNGAGGGASLLVGWAEYLGDPSQGAVTAVATVLAVLVGGVTLTGSVLAWAKLSERVSGRPILFGGQQVVNGVLLLGAVVTGVLYAVNPPAGYPFLLAAIVVALVLGVLAVLPIGGADMPIVISLLNSYSGIAASAAGFVIDNTVLIVAGSLVGASGLILTQIMCKAMNRSLANVLTGGGTVATGAGPADDVYAGKVKATSAEEIAMLFDGARRVVIVPGYGLAVSQAQHAVRDLVNLLEARGVEVEFAIHPVAGRMPGHMNVLLAEADVPYDKLKEMDEINPSFQQTDVAIVIGANDVVNPLARTDPNSPIAGMPILDVDKARTVVVIKRSLSPGFAGIPNPLFAADNTLMYFSDGKKAVMDLINAVKAA